MTNRTNLFRDADSRAQLTETTRPQTQSCRRQRTAINRNLRRLGWHRTTTKKVTK